MEMLEEIYSGIMVVVFWLVVVFIIFYILLIPYSIIMSIFKWLFRKKISKRFYIISLGIYVFFSVTIASILYVDEFYAPYIPYFMDKRMEEIGLKIALPPYKIDYCSADVEGYDFDGNGEMAKYYDYYITFEDEITSMLPYLDSLCAVDHNWEKYDGEYWWYENREKLSHSNYLQIKPEFNIAQFSIKGERKPMFYYFFK